jgi:hypothetical protein
MNHFSVREAGDPKALAKAESLHRFASHSGYPLETFALVLTETEAIELLEWYATEYCGNAAFDLDVEVARRTKNPWPVLAHFRVLGLDMMPALVLH